MLQCFVGYFSTSCGSVNLRKGETVRREEKKSVNVVTIEGQACGEMGT